MSLPHFYSIVIAVYPDSPLSPPSTDPDSPTPTTPADGSGDGGGDWRLGDITVDWVDYTREKSGDAMHEPAPSAPPAGVRRKARPEPARYVPGSSAASASTSPSPAASAAISTAPSAAGASRARPRPSSPSSLSLQPLLAHLPAAHRPPPAPLSGTPTAAGITDVGRGVVHLFKHAPPAAVVARLDGGGEPSGAAAAEGAWAAPDRAEGEDGSLVAVLAVPAWMRPSDFLEFIGGWATGLEGVRMIREATTPNRSIVLLKFRDPLQAADFMVIFTGRAFSTLDARETCHPIRIHHLVLHKAEDGAAIAVPAFPPSVYASRRRAGGGNTDGESESSGEQAQAEPGTAATGAAVALDTLIPGTACGRRELPTCPVCLERLDSAVTGLITLSCAHTFGCECLQRWGDSRCPVCRVSHLLLSGPGAPGTAAAPAKLPSSTSTSAGLAAGTGTDPTRLPQCGTCGQADSNWMCVVCGAVGCGRYAKAHARRHWETSGHGLAMELETQRVWDYAGDNYVHRLIRSRTDGTLVELPSASSLVAPAHDHAQVQARQTRHMPLGRELGSATTTPRHSPANSIHAAARPDGPAAAEGGTGTGTGVDAGVGAGPSATDIDKMSTIEAITLEYSYLLSSQLEAMRAHYEAELSRAHAEAVDLRAAEAAAHGLRTELDDARKARADALAARQRAEHERDRAEAKARQAHDVARALQRQLGDERAMSAGLEARVGALSKAVAESRARAEQEEKEKKELEDTVRDLMFTLEAGNTVRQDGVDGEGGDIVVVPKAKGKRRVRGG
ncbi:hypothetical protein Q5752_000234 [Cryptotrichosporon argae]